MQKTDTKNDESFYLILVPTHTALDEAQYPLRYKKLILVTLSKYLFFYQLKCLIAEEVLVLPLPHGIRH